MIDSDRMYAPRRAVKKVSDVGVVFTDHYPILVELVMPKAENTTKKPEPSWNTMKPGGWEKFKELSDKVADKINKIVADKDKVSSIWKVQASNCDCQEQPTENRKV